MIRTKPDHTLHTEFQTQVRSRGVCRDVSAMVRVVRAVCERARVCVCGSPRTRSAVKHQSSGARTDYTPSLFKRTCVSVCVCVCVCVCVERERCSEIRLLSQLGSHTHS